MTDWDKAYTASHEAGNWYPPDDTEPPMSLIDRVSLAAIYACCTGAVVAAIAAVAGYFTS